MERIVRIIRSTLNWTKSPLGVMGGCGRLAVGTAGLRPAPEIAGAFRTYVPCQQATSHAWPDMKDAVTEGGLGMHQNA